MREFKFMGFATMDITIANFIGGWGSAIHTLLIFMGIDMVLGLLLAGVFKRSKGTESGGISSEASFRGLVKKGIMLVLVYMGYRLDVVLEMNVIHYAVIIAFTLHEAISIIENAGLMGVPIPSALAKAIDVLKSKANESENQPHKAEPSE